MPSPGERLVLCQELRKPGLGSLICTLVFIIKLMHMFWLLSNFYFLCLDKYIGAAFLHDDSFLLETCILQSKYCLSFSNASSSGSLVGFLFLVEPTC